MTTISPKNHLTLGHIVMDIVWIRPYVGVHRGECSRCGLSMQDPEGVESRVYQTLLRHICDPSKKS